MKQALTLPVFTLLLFFTACQPEQPKNANPPAPTFNATGSDAKAIAIADEVMESSGGKENWGQCPFFLLGLCPQPYPFLGQKNGVISALNQKRTQWFNLMNINTMKGRVQIKGRELADAGFFVQFFKKGQKASGSMMPTGW